MVSTEAEVHPRGQPASDPAGTSDGEEQFGPGRRRAGSSLVRWFALLSTLIVALGIPYIHYTYGFWLQGSERRSARYLVFGLLLALFLLRPLVVLIHHRSARKLGSPLSTEGLTAIVPCCNCASTIGRLVEALLRQPLRPIEILLVENNSADDTWQVIQQFAREHPEVHAYSIRIEPGEYPLSVAVNFGIARATYNIILRLDDDSYVTEETLERAVAPITRGEAVAVACNLRVANVRASLWTRLQSLEYLLAMEMDRGSHSIARTIICCSGGMSLFRKDILLKAGGFVSLPRMLSEDMEMTLHSQRFGRAVMMREALGFTKVPETIRTLWRQRYRWAVCGTVTLYWHRRGLANAKYWYTDTSALDGLVGFVGLPFRAAFFLRDLFAFLLPFHIGILLSTAEGRGWLMLFVVARSMVLYVELLILSPALASRQGAAYWFLVPLFILVYGPVLIAVRFVGTWAALAHIVELRRKEEVVEREGLRPVERWQGAGFPNLVIERIGATRTFRVVGQLDGSVSRQVASLLLLEVSRQGDIVLDLSESSVPTEEARAAFQQVAERLSGGSRLVLSHPDEADELVLVPEAAQGDRAMSSRERSLPSVV